MVQGIDPALLIFAGRFLSRGGGDPSNGFGNALGAGLEAAGSQQVFRMEQERIRQQDLMKAAESSINMKKALQEIQIAEQQRKAEQDYLGQFSGEERLAKALDPVGASQRDVTQLDPDPLTVFQQEQLQRQDEQFELLQKQQSFENNLAVQKFDFQKAEALLPEKPKLSDISSFRKQYTTQSKDYELVKDGYKNVLTSSFGEGQGVSDIALLFGYMKMLDPGSVVREGEFDRVKLAAGPAAQWMNTWDFVKKGSLLPAHTRSKVRDLAGKFYVNAFNTQKEKEAGVTAIANRHNIDPRDITQMVPVTHPIDVRIEALGVTLTDIDETAQKYGLTHEQVVQQLERGGGG
jgi:hypothetical protein